MSSILHVSSHRLIGTDVRPQGLYASAENLFEHVMQLNTLESIQAILCCAMYSIRSPVGVSLWCDLGLGADGKMRMEKTDLPTGCSLGLLFDNVPS